MISRKYSEPFSAWSEALGQSVQSVGSESFYSSLCQGLAALPEMSHPLVLYFPKGEPPVAVYSDYTEAEDYRLQIEQYVCGPYILDPYYRLSENQAPNGVYRLREIAPDNYKHSEFYHLYYKAIKAEDELSFVQTLQNGDALHISLTPEADGSTFSKAMVQFIKTVAPVVIALNEQHWRSIETKPSSSRGHLHQELIRGLSLFGSSVLTEREMATLGFILQGHSNQSAADRLGISISTVKLHRKHIYKKLDIGSQSELFHLFIDSLSCLDLEEDIDPLDAYMKIP
ncbi:response regulator transcription factor [Pseudoteredinibacter isoporae]|uniref:response regulator transcription factor n=1 Tax=Pseudoteredinibacter isoporae TaxID=570281 RepID=UPI00310B72DD